VFLGRALLKVVRSPAKYQGQFRVADLGREAAALLLHFGQGLWAFRHAGKLKQPDARNY
jgi:hypothetical protein